MFTKIETIAIIGAGAQGREIALAALRAGYRTVLEDVSDDRLQQAVAWILEFDADPPSRLLLASTVEEAIREANLIIETVADEVEMKIEMFTIFDRFAKPDAIFASSSFSPSVTELAAVTFCPERCIGMRCIGKLGAMGTLELVCAPQTADETIARCREVGRRMGREVSIVAEREFTELR
jgi:3-hydroxybutyryl-CoA dehydrogenase